MAHRDANMETNMTVVSINGIKCYSIGPSDLTFLWEDCPRCFYRQVVLGVRRPRIPMAKIFTNIDHGMKAALNGARTEIIPGMPPGIFTFQEQWVESAPIIIPGHASRCRIRGRFDIGATFDNGTYGIPDLKTASVKDAHISLYSRQLGAYAYSLEHAAPGKFALSPVNTLGLVVFEPDAFVHRRGGGFLAGDVRWVELQRDDAAFIAFLGQVVSVLELPAAPPASGNCEFCRYSSAA
jgi:hypothetical protein